MNLLQKVLFSWKHAHSFILNRKHRRSSTVQGEGLTNEGRHHLLLLHKQAVRWAYFREKYYNSQKIAHPPSSFVELLKFIAHGWSFERLQYMPLMHQSFISVWALTYKPELNCTFNQNKQTHDLNHTSLTSIHIFSWQTPVQNPSSLPCQKWPPALYGESSAF